MLVARLENTMRGWRYNKVRNALVANRSVSIVSN